MATRTFRQTIALFGPGLLFAGAAVGVSHLVQSTRAGAEFGFGLLWAIILANLLKYPFFEFGPRYAIATGESLLRGYKKMGYWVLVFYALVTLLSVFSIQAAVTIVTAGIAEYLFPGIMGGLGWSAFLLILAAVWLNIGRYAWLDKGMKIIILVLTISTLAALAAASGYSKPETLISPPVFDWKNAAHIAFLIGLMGWMPAPIDLSVWHSLWSLEKAKTGKTRKLSEALLDFNFGYWGAAVLAVCFMTLGALMLYGSNVQLPSSGAAFANLLISIYTTGLGEGAKWVIAIAAFTTMLSTTITCFDAIPRTLSKTTILLKTNQEYPAKEEQLYRGWMMIVMSGSLFLIWRFSGSMTGLVQLATILSFLTAPFFAVFNFKLVTGRWMPEKSRPGKWMRLLSWAGLLFLAGFSLFYLYSLLKPAMQ